MSLRTVSYGLFKSRALFSLSANFARFSRQAHTNNFHSFPVGSFGFRQSGCGVTTTKTNTRSLIKNFSDNNNNTENSQQAPEQQKGQEQTTQEQNQTQSAGPEKQVSEEVAALKKALEEAQAKIKETEHKLALSFAERENLRKIKDREIDNSRLYGIQKFATEILETSDNLKRCLGAAKEEDFTPENREKFNQLQTALKMTYKEMMKTFERHSLVQFEPLDEPFDPVEHSAVFEVPDPSKKSGTVAVVVKAGFRLNSRLIRPATVGVVKNE